MDITITPSLLRGSITPPPSKSQAHRCIIAAALSEGESLLRNVAGSEDMEATIRCMEQLGAEVIRRGDELRVTGIGAGPMSPRRRMAQPRLDCGESGSTLRFLIPVALAVSGGGRFTGRGRLMERPQEPYFALFREKGIFYEQKDGTLTVRGVLKPGQYRLPGNVSSQFITGLLYALPLLEGESELCLTTPLESRDYVAMTLDALKRFGISVSNEGWRRFRIPGRQRYVQQTLTVEADWSQAAFWYVAAGVGNPVTVAGMDERSIQGDRVILQWGQVLRGEPMEGRVRVPVYGSAPDGSSEGRSARGECAVSLDVSQNPDLVPPLAAWGALLGEGNLLRLKNAGRLRIKESDRLDTVTRVLCAMGARVEEGTDCLDILGGNCLTGGVTVDSYNDHRIAMMAAIAATRCERPVTITNAGCVAKSYPNFWADYEALGGQIQRSETE